MTTEGHKFYVIYNRAANPMARTEDTELSLDFTKHLVSYLEDFGHTGFYADRDALPGRNIFSDLQNNLKSARRVILVVTPRFHANGWEAYSSQRALKENLDTKKTDKLIPIGLDIPDDMKLPDLNVYEWLHFTKGFKDERAKMDIVKQALENDGKWNQQPGYREQIHAREHGDNRLRTEFDNLMTQPSTTVYVYGNAFINNKFLMDLAENFPHDWKELALHLDVPDHKVLQVESDNHGRVKHQAYYALKYWREANPGTEEEIFVQLQGVLRNNMKRNDLANKIDEDYQVFKASREDCDELDALTNKTTHQTSVKEPVRSQQQTVNSNNSATVRIDRQLRLEIASATQSRPEMPEQQITPMGSVTLQEGPCLSLPSADIVFSNNSEQSKQAAGITDAESDEKDGINADRVSQQHQMENLKSVVTTGNERNDVKQNASQQPSIEMDNNTPDRERNVASGDARYKTPTRETENMVPNERGDNTDDHNVTAETGDSRGSSQQNPALSVSFGQQSLTQDSDLTADAQGSFSFSPNDDQRNGIPGSLPVKQGLPGNINSPSPSTDSGYSSSIPETPEEIQPVNSKHLQSKAQPAVSEQLQSKAQPAVYEQLQSKAQPAVSEQLQSKAQPAVSEQLQSTAQPAVSEQLQSKAQPAVSEQLQSTAQPAVSEQLQSTAQPAVSEQLQSKAQPAVPEQLQSKAQPAVSEQLQSTAQPAVSEQLQSKAQPAVSEQLQSKAQPSVSEQLKSTAQPAVSEQLQSKAQPAVSEQLQSTAQPAVSVQLQSKAQPAVSKPLLKDDVNGLQNQKQATQELEEDVRNHSMEDKTSENSDATTEDQISDHLPISPTLQCSDDTAEQKVFTTNEMSSQRNGCAYPKKKKSRFGFSKLVYLGFGLGVLLVSIIIYKKLKS